MNNTSQGNLTIQAGAQVISADGKQVGTVKEVQEDRFKVHKNLFSKFWLGNETIESTSSDQVQLLITKDGIGSAKLHDVAKIDRSDLPSDRIGGH
jgi:hypothetical protein